MATQPFCTPFKEFLGGWGSELKDKLTILPYEAIDLRQPLPSGTYLFTDFERMLPGQLKIVTHLANALAARPEHYRVINHPANWKDRRAFLNLLTTKSTNRYRVFNLNEIPGDLSFPVFLRRTDDHTAHRSSLLENRSQLDAAIAGLSRMERIRYPWRWLVCEFLDTSDGSGVFRKYSAIRMLDAIIPRHVFFSRNWMQKKADLIDSEQIQEEEDFIDNFPHAEEVRERFDLAGLDYGRIDYGLLNGELQVWEINSNPMIVPEPKRIAEPRIPGQARSAERIVETLRALSATSPNGAGTGWKPSLPVAFIARIHQNRSMRYHQRQKVARFRAEEN